MGSFSGGSTGLTINSTEPVSPNAGEIWSDSSNGVFYQRNAANDGWITLVKSPITDNIVYPQSTTIGDYTNPSSATSSSNGTDSGTKTQADSPSGNGNDGNSSTSSSYSNYYVSSGGTQTYIWTETNTMYVTSITAKVTYEYGASGKLQRSTDGSTWTDIGGINGTATFSNINADVKYIRVFSYKGSSGGSGDVRHYFINITGNVPTLPAKSFDDDNATYWKSSSESNPNVYFDNTSASNICGIAIKKNSSNNTETSIKIQTSTDGSTWTDKRTVTTSALTDDDYSFVRIPITSARYFRIYGNSGSSKVLALTEVKYMKKTNDEITSSHTHLEISSSDSSLGLDGS